VASTGDLIDLLYREPEKRPPRPQIGVTGVTTEPPSATRSLGGRSVGSGRSGRSARSAASTITATLPSAPRRLTGDSFVSWQEEEEPWHLAFMRNPVAFLCLQIHQISGELGGVATARATSRTNTSGLMTR
jgi:hypothetical protein